VPKSFFYGDCPVRAQYASPEQRSGYKKCPCFLPCKGFTIVEPFQAHWRPVPYLQALPGVVLYLPFRQYLVITDLCPPLIYIIELLQQMTFCQGAVLLRKEDLVFQAYDFPK
jgi:hypothetical protein